MFRRAPNRMDTIWRRPDIAPLFTCLGPPAPAVGCVALTQPGPRPKFVALQIGTGGARVGAGRMPWQAQTWLKATRTVCLRSRSRPNPAGRPTSTFLLQSKVCRHDGPDQHVCGVAASFRPPLREPAVLDRGDGTRPVLRFSAAARGADGAGPGRGAGAGPSGSGSRRPRFPAPLPGCVQRALRNAANGIRQHGAINPSGGERLETPHGHEDAAGC